MTDLAGRSDTDYRDLLRRVGVPLALVAGGAVAISAGVARLLIDTLAVTGLTESDAWGVGIVAAALVPPVVFFVVLRSLGPTSTGRRNAHIGLGIAVAAAIGYVLGPRGDLTLLSCGVGYTAGFSLTLGAVGQAVLDEDDGYATSGVRVRAGSFESPTQRDGPAAPADGGRDSSDIKSLADDE